MRRLLWISIVFAAILTVSCNKEDENSGQMSLKFPQVTGSIPRVFLFSDDPEKQFIEVDGITDPEKLEVIIDSEEPAFEIESINEKGIRIKPLVEPSFKIKATKIHIIEPGRSTKDNPSATLYVYLTATPASMEVYLDGNSRIAISDKRNGERYVFASNLEDVEKRIHLSENQSVRVYFQLVDKNGTKSQKMVLSEEVFVFEGEIIPSGNSALSDNLVCDHEVLTAAENVEKMNIPIE